MNWNEWGWKWPWRTVKQHPSSCLVGLRKTTKPSVRIASLCAKTWTQDEARVLPTQSQRSHSHINRLKHNTEKIIYKYNCALLKYSGLSDFITLKDGLYGAYTRAYAGQQFRQSRACAHLPFIPSPRTMQILICLWGTQYSANTKRFHFLNCLWGLTPSIPQQLSHFCFNNHFLLTSVLLISTLQFVTRVKVEAILGRPATNIGTKHNTFIPFPCKMLYSQSISVLYDVTYWGEGDRKWHAKLINFLH